MDTRNVTTRLFSPNLTVALPVCLALHLYLVPCAQKYQQYFVFKAYRVI